MKYFFSFCCFLFFINFGSAQPVAAFPEKDLALLEAYEDTLGLMSYIIVNDSLPENRFAATKKMIKTLVQALKVPNSFNYPFEQIKTISIQYPEDRSFRIFTWQLYVDKDDYRYYGAIQMNTPELELFPLIDRSESIQNIEYQQLKAKQWYGSLYYNIKDYDTPQGKKYLLFGFDGYSFFEKRKVVETLAFQAGQPVFGVPDIMAPSDSGGLRPIGRFALTYSAEASIVCNFDELENKVVYNHLTIGGNAWEGKPTYIPSGSYDGFELDSGKWIYREELFKVITPEGQYPRPEPVLDAKNSQGKKRDLFGN